MLDVAADAAGPAERVARLEERHAVAELDLQHHHHRQQAPAAQRRGGERLPPLLGARLTALVRRDHERAAVRDRLRRGLRANAGHRAAPRRRQEPALLRQREEAGDRERERERLAVRRHGVEARRVQVERDQRHVRLEPADAIGDQLGRPHHRQRERGQDRRDDQRVVGADPGDAEHEMPHPAPRRHPAEAAIEIREAGGVAGRRRGRARLQAAQRGALVVLGVPARHQQPRPVLGLAHLAARRRGVDVAEVRRLVGRGVERHVQPRVAGAHEHEQVERDEQRADGEPEPARRGVLVELGRECARRRRHALAKPGDRIQHGVHSGFPGGMCSSLRPEHGQIFVSPWVMYSHSSTCQ